MDADAILYASYADMWQRCMDMAERMPDVDAIAGVPVSGLASAGMLSAATGIPAVPIDAVPPEVRRLLVLEDASGFALCIRDKMGQCEDRETLYGAVYACDKAAASMDIIGCIAPKPRIFTWNLTKSDRCARIAYDLDGVLCTNPAAAQIDYAERYAQFVAQTPRRRYAKSVLGWIVTGRMERYRAATVAWLQSNGIRHRELVMAPDSQQHTMEAHAKHKADWYSAHPDCMLFVESHPRQAARIAELTGRPVVCAETEQSWHCRVPECAPSRKRHDRIIYTISTGGYESYAPTAYRPPECWDYRVIRSADCPAYLSPKRQAAWAKINGPRIFRDYEASLCIDDDMTVTQDPSELFGAREMVTLRRDRCPTWHADLRLAASERGAVLRDRVDSEIARIAAAGVPDGPCYYSGVLYRRHTPATRALCDAWWAWYVQSETERDQPSLAAACTECGYTPDTITEPEMSDCITHDARKADRDGVRNYAPGVPAKQKPRRKGDRGRA